MKTWLAFWSGIFKNNPTFRLVLGLCPTLAVTTSLENALGMGLAASFVLVCSNGLVSALRKVIPAAVHIPCYIVIIATFVTAVDLLMQAYLPALSESLGIFIPLIVVNCIILGRAEAFACKNGVVESLADGLGTGVGFTLALALVAAVREILGAGSLTVWGDIAIKNVYSDTVVLAILPAGGFPARGRFHHARTSARSHQPPRRRAGPPPRRAAAVAGQPRLPPLHALPERKVIDEMSQVRQ